MKKGTVGIIAGKGGFPILSSREAKKQGFRIAVCAIEKEADPALEETADSFCWVKLGEIRKLVKFFKQEGVSKALMVGKVEKVRLFQENLKPDLDMVKVLMKTHNFKDDSLLLGVVEYLEENEIRILDSTIFLKESIPGEGLLGKKKPSKEVMDDIHFGYEMAKSIAGLDIGQTVVVKRKAVMAVEAIEGTDEAILRGGRLGKEKVTVVKVSKPNQDMRFDVPAVGMETIQKLMDVQAAALAFEAGKTLFLDLHEFIQKADKAGIVLMGIEEKNKDNTF